MSESFNTLFSLNERSQKLNKKSRLVFLNNLITISSSKIFGNTAHRRSLEKNVDIRKKMEFLIELESELNVKRKLRTTINVNKEIIIPIME